MEKELKERKEIIIVKKKLFWFLALLRNIFMVAQPIHTHTHACSTNKTHFANLQDSRFSKQKRNEMGNVNSC